MEKDGIDQLALRNDQGEDLLRIDRYHTGGYASVRWLSTISISTFLEETQKVFKEVQEVFPKVAETEALTFNIPIRGPIVGNEENWDVQDWSADLPINIHDFQAIGVDPTSLPWIRINCSAIDFYWGGENDHETAFIGKFNELRTFKSLSQYITATQPLITPEAAGQILVIALSKDLRNILQTN